MYIPWEQNARGNIILVGRVDFMIPGLACGLVIKY